MLADEFALGFRDCVRVFSLEVKGDTAGDDGSVERGEHGADETDFAVCQDRHYGDVDVVAWSLQTLKACNLLYEEGIVDFSKE
jgi:hypothetical protein